MSRRVVYLLCTVAVIGTGLLSRSGVLPPESFLARYSGDTLWAMMVYFGFRFLHPGSAKKWSLTAALLFSYLIEISQLIQTDWLNGVRATRLGGLILGFGFLWSDILCYTVGIAIAFFIDSKAITKDS